VPNYFEADGAAELARDLSAPSSFRRWVTDLASPALLKMLHKAIGGPLLDAGSPLKFAPHEGPQFFARYGWKMVENAFALTNCGSGDNQPNGCRISNRFG
jgi:hypothetical protein